MVFFEVLRKWMNKKKGNSTASLYLASTLDWFRLCLSAAGLCCIGLQSHPYFRECILAIIGSIFTKSLLQTRAGSQSPVYSVGTCHDCQAPRRQLQYTCRWGRKAVSSTDRSYKRVQGRETVPIRVTTPSQLLSIWRGGTGSPRGGPLTATLRPSSSAKTSKPTIDVLLVLLREFVRHRPRPY
jgi:hypothetical protein